MIRFAIDEDVARAFPQVFVNAFRVRGLGRVRLDADELAELWTAARAALAPLAGTDVAAHPLIAPWRAAAQASGIKAARHRSSAEQLVRRTLKDGSVPGLAGIVSAYCALSARALAPLGVSDVARLPGDALALRFARPDEDRFAPLGGDPADMPLGTRVVVYACGPEVVCWNFNTRDSARTALVPETDDALFFGEAVAVAQVPAVRGALSDLCALLARHGAECGPLRAADAAARAFEL
jgi:DNA/RNA-binding domain of Phe-tRNA-synthetase-like protein